MEKETAFWEEYGRIYPNLEKARPYHNLSKVLRKLIEAKNNEVWLDVGCGPLRISELIYEKSNGRVKAIEAVDIVLEPAREKLAKLTQQGIRLPVNLRYADIGKTLPYSDNYFDGIGANLVLPYISDFEGKKGKAALEGILREMFRILKPGGQLVWSTPKSNVNFIFVFIASIPDMLNIYEYISKRDFTRILQGSRILKHALEIQRKGRSGLYNFLPQEELADLLNKIGFNHLVWEKTFAGQVLVNRAEKPK